MEHPIYQYIFSIPNKIGGLRNIEVFITKITFAVLEPKIQLSYKDDFVLLFELNSLLRNSIEYISLDILIVIYTGCFNKRTKILFKKATIFFFK